MSQNRREIKVIKALENQQEVQETENATDGIFEGYEDGTFRRKQTVSREVAVITLLRIQKKRMLHQCNILFKH